MLEREKTYCEAERENVNVLCNVKGRVMRKVAERERRSGIFIETRLERGS